MTTETAIEYRRQHDIEKMMSRFRRVGLTVDHRDKDIFILAITENPMTVIYPPYGKGWQLSQLHNLLALIFKHGRPSKYELTLREQGGIAQFKLNIMVPCGADPFQVAGELAACRKCEVHELWRVEE